MASPRYSPKKKCKLIKNSLSFEKTFHNDDDAHTNVVGHVKWNQSFSSQVQKWNSINEMKTSFLSPSGATEPSTNENISDKMWIKQLKKSFMIIFYVIISDVVIRVLGSWSLWSWFCLHACATAASYNAWECRIDEMERKRRGEEINITRSIEPTKNRWN